jgi:hypothetical protein
MGGGIVIAIATKSQYLTNDSRTLEKHTRRWANVTRFDDDTLEPYAMDWEAEADNQRFKFIFRMFVLELNYSNK